MSHVPLVRVPSVKVAIGVLIHHDQREWRVLITRRSSQSVLAGYWEFLGGKLHAGESAQQCVVREFEEEVALRIEPVRALRALEHEYEHAHVQLFPFLCRWIAGEVEHRAVADHRWLRPAELKQYEFPPANQPLLTDIDSLFNSEAGPW